MCELIYKIENNSKIYKFAPGNQRSNCQHPLDHGKRKRVPEKHVFLLYDYAKAFDSVDHSKLENSERDGNTGPPDMSFEKPVCRSGCNS